MNTTVKYVLIGGAVAGAVYLVAKSAQPAQTPLQTVTGGISSVVASITGALKGSNQPPKPTDQATDDGSGKSIARLSSSLPHFNSGGAGSYAPSAWSSYGDAAISDGAGYSHLAGRSVGQPTNAVTPAQRALYGDSPKSKFAIR